MPALQMAAIRQMIGGSVFILFFLLYKKLSLPTAKQFRWLLVMAVIMFVSANGLSTWSIKIYSRRAQRIDWRVVPALRCDH